MFFDLLSDKWFYVETVRVIAVTGEKNKSPTVEALKYHPNLKDMFSIFHRHIIHPLILPTDGALVAQGDEL